MLKMTVTKAVISKVFNGEDALKFSENTDNCCRAGVRAAFEISAERGEVGAAKLQIFVPTQRRCASFRSRSQAARQQFKNTHEKKTAPILIAEEIEFASSGGTGKQNSNGAATAPTYSGYATTPVYSGQPQPQYGGYVPQPQPGNFE